MAAPGVRRPQTLGESTETLGWLWDATPDACALTAPGRSPMSFAGLRQQVTAVSAQLTAAGATRRDVIALALPDGPEFLSLCAGVVSVAACAPLNPALTRAELHDLLSDLGATALIVGEGEPAHVAEVCRELGIALATATRGTREGAGSVALADFELPPSRPLDSHADTALLLHTSATTGRPRLVPHSLENLHGMVERARLALALNESDRFLSMMPLFHLQGLISVLAQLAAGGSVVCTSGFHAGEFPGWLEAYRPTWYTAGPALHGAILALAPSLEPLLARAPLRFIRSIGAPLPLNLMEELESALRAPLVEGYGMTETGLVTSQGLHPGSRKPGSVGRSAGLDVAVLGDGPEPLPAGAVGQIAVRGDTVFDGYRNGAAETLAVFRNGWFLTGDLGRLDDEGFLFVTGRIKEMINRGGEKVHPPEVDAVLARHPAVAEAAAFGLPHPTLGEDVAAAVVLHPGASASESELRQLAVTQLAAFKIPRRVFFLESIPRGATGKPQRAALAEQVLSRYQEPLQSKRVPPHTAMEKRLAGIWLRLLNITEIGVEDDFFSLGGDSFSAALLLTELEIEFDADHSLFENSDFFTTPTIKNLARILSYAGKSGRVAPRGPGFGIVALQPHGALSPFFCFPGADENPYYFRALAKEMGAERPFLVVRDRRPLLDRGVYSVEEQAAGFAAAIRDRQPHGPYHLGGHCYGGILAFEVAGQLMKLGEPIGLLAMFETPAPGYPRILKNWTGYREQLAAMARGEVRVGPRDVAAHAFVVGRLAILRLAAGIRRWMRSAGFGVLVPAIHQVNFTNQRAARDYRPRPTPVTAVQFIAAGEHHSTRILDDPRIGWREWIGDRFAVQEVPGTADALFVEPNVEVLAQRLRLCLQRSDANTADHAISPRESRN